MTIALWCVLAAVLLPYVCFGVAVNRSRKPDGGRLRDNHNPRDFPSHLEGLAKRAWGAQLNSFESLPGFAAAVIIAHLVHASQNPINVLAVAWVLARIAYVAFYLTDKATLRSTTQFVSLACVLGLFVLAGLG
ncbi:MAG TPA: MAPEG family protein [Rhodanobacteraceae bacterium]|nr:MAPEG family protein [Rhodanobacteraceae bacterium]